MQQLGVEISANSSAASSFFRIFKNIFACSTCEVYCAGVTSSNACPLPSVRIIKEFDEGEAQAGIDSAHVAILSGMAKRDMRQKVVSWAAVAASIALSSALLWLFSSRKYSRKHLT